VLTAFEREPADRLREAARRAQAAVRLRAMFLLAGEVTAAAEAFAQKFDDVRRRHRVLWGRDPFAALVPSRAALLGRINQVLLNLALRLRAAYVEQGPREVASSWATWPRRRGARRRSTAWSPTSRAPGRSSAARRRWRTSRR
jgi:hypothetical protein